MVEIFSVSENIEGIYRNHITQFCLSGALPKYRFRAAAKGLLKVIFREKFLLESFAVLNGEFYMRKRLL